MRQMEAQCLYNWDILYTITFEIFIFFHEYWHITKTPTTITFPLPSPKTILNGIEMEAISLATNQIPREATYVIGPPCWISFCTRKPSRKTFQKQIHLAAFGPRIIAFGLQIFLKLLFEPKNRLLRNNIGDFEGKRVTIWADGRWFD